MNFNTLVNKYRGKLAFHGGIDTQDLLINATPGKVTEVVEEQVRVAKHKVPYIVSGSQNFTEDTPLENILALYKMSQSI
jgi:uroporphyrinogen decarboxylase